MSSDDQLDLVRSTVRGVLAGPSAELTDLGELGMLGLLVAEDRGGMGWCPVEAAVVADEIGRAVSAGVDESAVRSCSSTSWVAASVAAGALALTEVEGDRLASAISGERPAVAVAGLLRVDGGLGTGSLANVDLPPGATSVVVLSPSGDCHLLDLGSDGVSVRPDPTSMDTTRPLQRIDISRAPIDLIGRDDLIHAAARTLVAAVSVGSLRGALDRLIPYLSDRIAFGAPIASFQAIQHRIVDLSLLEIRAGVAVDAAARALAADRSDAPRLAAVAHAFVMDQVAPAIDECIQLTGGIGFTWEYPLHHELRRSVADESMFGSARQSREDFLEVTAWV